MILSLLTIVTVLCHGLFPTCSATSQFTSTGNCELQELENKADATDILNDYLSNDFGTFKIYIYRASWNDARNVCIDGNAQLAVIDSAGEETMLLKYMKANNISTAWLGVHDLFGDKQWTTIKGDRLNSLDYVHWAKGEPNNARRKEHCVELNENGMNDRPCGDSMSFICEKSSEKRIFDVRNS